MTLAGLGTGCVVRPTDAQLGITMESSGRPKASILEPFLSPLLHSRMTLHMSTLLAEHGLRLGRDLSREQS